MIPKEYHKNKMIKERKSDKKVLGYWCASFGICCWVGVICYWVTGNGWFMLICVAGFIFPILSTLWYNDISTNSNIHSVKKKSIQCDIPIYYYENQLRRVSDDRRVYFDRLTSAIYTYPDNKMVYRVIFPGNYDWFSGDVELTEDVTYEEVT